MESTGTLKRLCGKLWVSGSLRVESTGREVTLRKRYYPIICAVWCFGIMGGLGYLAAASTSNPTAKVAFMGYPLLLALLFVGVIIFMDRKPPLLIFDRASSVIKVPSLNLSMVVTANGPRLGLQEVEFDNGEGRIKGGALYILIHDKDDGTPFFVEHRARSLQKRLERFAEETGMSSVVLPAQSL